MPLDTEMKKQIIEDFKRDANDTGSVEVQVALITHRVKELTAHLKNHKHDYASTRGLKKLVGQRRRLLRYLSKQDTNRYRELCARLGLRP